MPTLSEYGRKLAEYLSTWTKSGKQYDAEHPATAVRKPRFSAGLANLVAAELDAPVLTVGTITNTTIALSWAAVDNATVYKVRMSKYKGRKGVAEIYSGADTSTTVTGLTPGVRYYFTMTAGADTYVTSISLPKSGKTLDVLAAPSEIVASEITFETLTLTWTAVPGATGYVVESATDEVFEEDLLVLYTGSNLTVPVTDLSPETTYYFRVRINNANHNSFNYAITTAETLEGE